MFHCVLKSHFVKIHKELDRIAMGTASKAVVVLIPFLDHKGWAFLVMKRAKSLICDACTLHFDLVRNDLYEIDSLA